MEGKKQEALRSTLITHHSAAPLGEKNQLKNDSKERVARGQGDSNYWQQQ